MIKELTDAKYKEKLWTTKWDCQLKNQNWNILDLRNIKLYMYNICGGGQKFEWAEHTTSEVEDNTIEIIWGKKEKNDRKFKKKNLSNL